MSKKKNYKILYVEDYPVIQAMYVDALTEHGFNVTTASDGEEALKRAGEQDFDVIVLDIILPNITGPDFLREYIKQHSPSNVVILSDFDKPELIEEVKGLGVKHFWIKVETSPYQLIERLERLLAERAS